MELRLEPHFHGCTSSVDFIDEVIFLHSSYMTPELLIHNISHEVLHILIWRLTHIFKATQFLDTEIGSKLICPLPEEVVNQGFDVRYYMGNVR